MLAAIKDEFTGLMAAPNESIRNGGNADRGLKPGPFGVKRKRAEYGGKAGTAGRELRLRGTAAAGVPAPVRR